MHIAIAKKVCNVLTFSMVWCSSSSLSIPSSSVLFALSFLSLCLEISYKQEAAGNNAVQSMRDEKNQLEKEGLQGLVFAKMDMECKSCRNCCNSSHN